MTAHAPDCLSAERWIAALPESVNTAEQGESAMTAPRSASPDGGRYRGCGRC